MSVLFGPAEAIAAARCLTARSIADGRTLDHPRRCGWCVEPPADLKALVEGFNAWAGYKPTGKSGGTSERHEVRLWMELDRDEQRRLIEDAQAFVDPVEVVAAPPADAGGSGNGKSVGDPAAAPATASEAAEPLQPPDPEPRDVAPPTQEGPAWLA